MSLFKQLWLAVILLLSVVFGGSLIVNSLSAKNYLEQQLYMKNVDNANALALSLTQQQADAVLLELTLAAQFDTGHYELIELRDPAGNSIIRREDSGASDTAPEWFMQLLPIEVAAGQAQVQSGWQQVGTLTLRSHSRFAYRELWASTRQLALLFLVAVLLAGLLGSYLLRIILRPLDAVIEQAEAIGERRFITIAEPRTREFRRVVAAMNLLSDRIRAMLKQEASRLEKWQREAHLDKVTGLLNRTPFMQTLEAALESDDVNASGSLALIRLGGLARLNQTYGRKAVDGLLAEVGTALNRIAAGQSRWVAARLNGADFALLAARSITPEQVGQEIQHAVREVIENRAMQQDITLPCAATLFEHGDSIAALMTRLDGALIAADREGQSRLSVPQAGDIEMMPVREQMQRWQSIFDQAFEKQKFSLARFPVAAGPNRELLHYEAPLRLEREGEQLTAGSFLAWANRLQLSAELDRHVIDLALRMIAVSGRQLAVNLSADALVDTGFPHWLGDHLANSGEAAARLWLEVPETAAFRHLDSFRKLCARARTYGCKVGIEHVGHQLADIGRLHDVGLDYLKVDASFVRDIDCNSDNQTLLRTLATVAHSIGLTVIAEGVRTETEWRQLEALGIDGATGPAVTAHEQRE
ncbi:bifunctional diguanylate cyclase/phosphodiesterase [Kineobactrum salinum]|uniref:EAL domain-containing protein n=1 Tax=Kineobactrum salinum TaxID=2708301 RepID=A0A6C0TZH5_9GAMM|nr:EAL domain-containing protein [Kineobactrum salinum]QIB64769.1 EAL domain-containing protein [Kineobactrum salinum]